MIHITARCLLPLPQLTVPPSTAAMESSSSSASKTARSYDPSITSILLRDHSQRSKTKVKPGTPSSSSLLLLVPASLIVKKLLCDIGTLPTAECDHDHDAPKRGEIQTISQEAFLTWDSISPTLKQQKKSGEGIDPSAQGRGVHGLSPGCKLQYLLRWPSMPHSTVVAAVAVLVLAAVS